GSDHGLAGGYVLKSGDRAASRIHEPADLVAHLSGQHPPALFPGAYAAGGPGVGIAVEGVVHAARHGAEGIADEVGGSLQDGEFGAVTQQVVAHGLNIVMSAEDFFMAK